MGVMRISKRTFTKAPMTPRDVRRRYSKGRVFEVVFKKGYKKSGIWAASHTQHTAEGITDEP